MQRIFQFTLTVSVLSWMAAGVSFGSDGVAFGPDALEYDATRLFVADRPQFLFDNLFIESVQNLTRRMHSPRKVPAPLISSDRPWEHITYFTCNAWRVLRDPADGVFKCWYEDWLMHQDEWCKRHDWYGGSGGPGGSYPTRYLFARSQDGLKWEKPKLGIVIEDGHDTNIIFGDREFGTVHAAYVLLDSLEKDPQHRFKMLFNHRPRAGLPKGVFHPGHTAWASSPDGIRWKLWGKLPQLGIWGPHLGDVQTVSIDHESRTYLLNTRHNKLSTAFLDPTSPRTRYNNACYLGSPTQQNKRRISRAESANLLQWPEVQPLLTPDERLDNVDDTFYGMVQYRTHGMWIGFLNVFHMTENMIDVQLIFSRDGRRFNRFMPGRAWLRTGKPGAWDQYMVNICSPPVDVGDDLYVYYGGSKNHHDWWLWKNPGDKGFSEDMSKVGYCLGLARMKRDRFVSLWAGAVRQGILVTRPFYSSGGKLLLNARCAEGGRIEVQVARGSGKRIDGFGRDQCQAFASDAVAHQVTWKDEQSLPKGWLKLHFFIRDADLYTFRVKR